MVAIHEAAHAAGDKGKPGQKARSRKTLTGYKDTTKKVWEDAIYEATKGKNSTESQLWI